MRGKTSSENYLNKPGNDNNTIIDLTEPIDSTREIYSSGESGSPEREAKTWCSYMEREFRASRIMTDAQAGTHIDTPLQLKEK